VICAETFLSITKAKYWLRA